MQDVQTGRPRKVLLVYPDYTTEHIKDSAGSYSEGLASISAVLKKGGHQVALYHMTQQPEKEDFVKKLGEHADTDVVAFTVRTTAFTDVCNFLKWSKEALPNAITLCGGYHPTLDPEAVITAECVDAICIGEGEYPTLELCDCFGDEEKMHAIRNLWFNTAQGVIRNPVRPCISSLEELPLPDYDLFDYDNLASSRMKTALVMVSRGCIFSCTYCSNSKLREVYPNKAEYARFRSPENAISLLQTLLERYPYIKYINFRDAILNMKKVWFEQFIVLYREKIHLPFTGNLRLDLLSEDVVQKLAEAGCYMIDVGLESGDYLMRKKYLQRNMTDEQIINSFQWFRKYGITSMTYNIVGLPHEDLKLALKTVKLNAVIRPDRMIANIFTPFPMTRLTDIAREDGFLGDTVDFNRRVFLEQPQFPERQVLFVEDYFSAFVKLYHFAWRLPRPLSKGFEKMLDAFFVTPHKPHGFLVACYDLRTKSVKKLKRTLLKASPKLYLKLRDAVVMKRSSSRTK
ncbi:MAG: radical SAM protein [Clostridia bacterium]|nr:radical SAM protein [Clostridia bacterium]